MKIEEAEYIFGKRWHAWSTEERKEFVGALTVEELSPTVVPGVLAMALAYPESLHGEARDFMLCEYQLARLRRMW